MQSSFSAYSKTDDGYYDLAATETALRRSVATRDAASARLLSELSHGTLAWLTTRIAAIIAITLPGQHNRGAGTAHLG